MASNLEQQEIRRNWLDLPSDVTANILNRIGIFDILENAQKVCTAWYKICKDPALWRVLNMNDLWNSHFSLYTSYEKIDMFKQAMDRSQGQLVDITLVYHINARLFPYVADRSSQLRRLELVSGIYTGCLTKDALVKFPLLEELNLYWIQISIEEIETVGRYCPMLKTLKVNQKVPRVWMTDSTTTDEGRSNAIAMAIGENLLELRHLELIGNAMTNIGLKMILDNCHCLEILDLRACYNIDLKGDLGKKCSEQIKNLKLPNDSLVVFPYFNEMASGLVGLVDDYEYILYVDDDFEEFPDYCRSD
ncbi:hypothetical protein SSX86_018420 [Deinandra increscens subsp. villosa]|uniref:F-box domain-containing protein n=1 Tax=Deinandra increscens subsp. villosa TaxID=3103831 RepID=A0AAP0CQQ1_9ASTR